MAPKMIYCIYKMEEWNDHDKKACAGVSKDDENEVMIHICVAESETEIGRNSFRDGKAIKTIQFCDDHDGVFSWSSPSSSSSLIRKIGGFAFAGCTGLTEICLPASIERIGQSTFYDCVNLTSVWFESHRTGSSSHASTQLHEIPAWCFRNCRKLRRIDIPNSVERIGQGAFRDCCSLTEMNLPPALTHLGAWAFHRCTTLISVDLAICSNLRKIGLGAFIGCSALTTVLLPEIGLEEIGERAFYSCTQLSTVNIPSSVQTLGRYAFAFCRSLAGTVLPDSLLEIQDQAFLYCSAMDEVRLPKFVKEIGACAFAQCHSLVSVNFPTTNTMQEIGTGAFLNCIALESINEIPGSVHKLGSRAFCSCVKLSAFAFGTPSKLMTIEEGTFEGCAALTNIELPNSIQSIGKLSFSDCKELQSITLSHSLVSIGASAFLRCLSMTKILLGDLSPSATKEGFFFWDIDDPYFSNDWIYCNGAHVAIVFPKTLHEIGQHAFYECESLEHVFATSSIRFHCDVVRGGALFLQRRGRWDHEGVDDNDSKKAYPSSLWPLILNRVLNKMKLPQDLIFCAHRYDDEDTDELYTEIEEVRRSSVIFYLLAHGAAMDC